MATAGYSGTLLPKKLGLKDGQAVAFAGLPDSLRDLPAARRFASVETVADWPAIRGDKLDYIHLFTDRADTVRAALPALRDRILPDGEIWMSWPKKASKVPTDVTGDVVRSCALADVLVHVKVCAVDDVWSGLKLVVHKELRPAHRNATKEG